MNQNSGVYIFRDKDDTPILIAYKRINNMRYLAMMHYSDVIISYYTTYHILLDTIPIKSLLLGVHLPVLSNREKTITNWYYRVLNAMKNY
jgi:hypothetical protein